MATLRDVARLSGVSPATVSNVLNNRLRNTTPQTRQRVLDAIKHLGYRPGLVPHGPQRHASARTIGLVMWLAHYAPLSGYPYALGLLDGILTVCLTNHYNLTILSVEHWDDARAQVRLYADGRCDGFLLIAPPDTTISDALLERDYPYVSMSTGSDNDAISSVGIDDVAAMRELTNYILSKGHRRVAYLIGDEAMHDTARRIEGYRLAHVDHGLEPTERWIIRPGSYDIPEATATFNGFLDRILQMPKSERPTAVMCGNDQLAHRAWVQMKSRGLNMPDDISLSGFDGTHYAEIVQPSLATVKQPLFEMGMEACKLLLSNIPSADSKSAHTRQAPQRITFPHELLPGGSIKDLQK